MKVMMNRFQVKLTCARLLYGVMGGPRDWRGGLVKDLAIGDAVNAQLFRVPVDHLSTIERAWA